jgi:hypothetical protein
LDHATRRREPQRQADAPTHHFAGALAQLKPSLRSVGASRA